MFPRHGSGTSSRSSSLRPSTPNRSVTGQGRPKLIRRRVDPVLQHRAVLDQVKAKAGQLALLSNPGVGKPDRRHQVAVAERRPGPGSRSCRSCRPAAPGPSPSGRRRSRPSQPSASSVSWTRRAPVIDSIDARRPARGGPPRFGGRASSASRRRVARRAGLGALPVSESRQTSTFFRLRSNPACNIEVGPPLSSLLGDSRSVSPKGALLHGSPEAATSALISRQPIRPRGYAEVYSSSAGSPGDSIFRAGSLPLRRYGDVAA